MQRFAAALLALAANGVWAGSGPLKGNPYFDVKDGHVRFSSKLGTYSVTQADVTTFEYLGGFFARDRDHVFFGEKPVEGADPASFVAIDDKTGRDAHAIFRADERCEPCDLASFQRISDQWYVDKNSAYAALNNGWRRIAGVDSGSFAPLNNWYAKDRRRVYLHATPVPGADSQSFKLAACGVCEVCGEDRNRCYAYENAVPCDCQPRSNFPRPLTEVRPGTAVVSWRWGLRGAQDAQRSAGLLVLDAGRRDLVFDCLLSGGRGEQLPHVAVELNAGQYYRFRSTDPRQCTPELDRPALIQGQAEMPEIFFRDSARKRDDLQLELTAGTHKLIVVCRDVTRTAVNDQIREISVDLEAGRIYRLRYVGPYRPDHCDVESTVAGPG